MARLFPRLSVFILLTGCLSAPFSVSSPNGSTIVEPVKLSDSGIVKQALDSQFKEWRSVRYRHGGISKKGIDCSGFVYITYQKLFNITLPRNTKAQSKFGKRIFQKNLRPGDLVFFKTGWFTRHVGIYRDNRNFIHASSRKGVHISSLDSRYWSRKYWKSIRVKNKDN